jgi:hypothetical protein
VDCGQMMKVIMEIGVLCGISCFEFVIGTE